MYGCFSISKHFLVILRESIHFFLVFSIYSANNFLGSSFGAFKLFEFWSAVRWNDFFFNGCQVLHNAKQIVFRVLTSFGGIYRSSLWASWIIRKIRLLYLVFFGGRVFFRNWCLFNDVVLSIFKKKFFQIENDHTSKDLRYSSCSFVDVHHLVLW